MRSNEVSGVYRVRNTVSGDCYIGASKNVHRRMRQQAARLRRADYNCNPNLKAAWQAHGEAAFAFEVLIICAPGDLALYEQLATDALAPAYNKRLLDVSSNTGVQRQLSPESRERLRQRVTAMNRGRTLSEATRGKIAAKRRGSAEKYCFRGKSLSIREAAAEHGLPEPTLRMRLKAGWDTERAISTPPKPDRRRMEAR